MTHHENAAIKVADIEAFAMRELARAADSEGVSRELRTEWAYGVALLLRDMKHGDVADRIETERKKLFTWSEHIDNAQQDEQ